MDSSIPEVTLKGKASNESAAQGSSSVKKRGKGNDSPAGFIDLIGGSGSFASLLGEKVMASGLENGSESVRAESHARSNGMGKASISGINGGREFFFLKRAMGHQVMETIALGGEIPSEKNAKTSSGIPSTGEIPEARAELASEQGERIFLNEGMRRFGSAEKALSGAAKLSDGEAAKELAALSSDGLQGNSVTKKNLTDEVRGYLGDEMGGQKYRHDQDLTRGSDVKGSNISKVSQNPNGSEMPSNKGGNQYSTDIVKDNTISFRQITTETEKLENYKNLSTEGLKSERSLENTVNDIQTGKTDSLLSTGQTDFSMVDGIWNDARTGTNDRIASVSFQEVAGQIIDGASNMLMKGSSRIVITLEPPNLGTLNMDVRVQHDMVRMLLIADNHEVKQVLHANLDQLKTALQGQGLNVDRFDVLVQDRSYSGNQGFQPGGGTLFDSGRGRRDDMKDDSLLPQMLPSGGNEVNEPSLGIISLFV